MTTAEDQVLNLAEKIRRFRSEGMDKKLSEQDTKAVLIEPLLEIIGWAVGDPMRVSREDRPTVRPVDYSLKIGGEPKVVVECKRLSNLLDNPSDLEQAIYYASTAGVRWCVLTNGCLFRIYNSLAAEVAKNKLLAEIALERVGEREGLSARAALQTLELISPESIETGRIGRAWEEAYTGTKIVDVVEELWSEPDPRLVNLVRDRMKQAGQRLSGKQTQEWLGRLEVKIETRSRRVPVVKPGPKPGPTVVSPTQITIGAYAEGIKYSYEILTKTAEWLIGQGKLTASGCPISSGRRRNIVNTKPSHRDGGDFRAPRQLSNGLWIETHHSTAGCVGYARRLLKRFGYSEDMLEVE